MPDTPWLDPTPDTELMGNTLDLGRAELRPLMERYGTERPSSDEALLNPPTALIVTNHRLEEVGLRQVLENDGWNVESCPGPEVGKCPVLRGDPCSLRKSTDAAVVFVDLPRGSRAVAEIPRLRCAADSSSPGVLALEGRIDPPRFTGRTATVGALRGPEAIVAVVDALTQPQDVSDS